MIAKIIETLAVFTTGVISAMGYGGVVLLMAIESACIPLPSEIIMPFAGYLVYQGQFTLQGAAIAGAVGCVVGSIPAYYLGMYGGRPVIERWGRYVLLSGKELDLAERIFQRHGHWVVFGARLLPVVRTFIAFPAGVARMNRVKFHVYTFVGSLPWCYALGYVGQRLGLELMSEHSPLKHFMHKFDAVIAAVIIIGGIWFVRSRLKALKQYKEAEAAAAPTKD